MKLLVDLAADRGQIDEQLRLCGWQDAYGAQAL